MKDALRDEIPPGTLYLLVLKTLHRGENHGYGSKKLADERTQFRRVHGAIMRVFET